MTWESFAIYMQDIHGVSIIARLLLASVFGALLGMDRARKHRPAGFRTHMLVCLGSAIVMMTNQYMMNVYGSGDPGRMGAQVISGIGFLGAGTIIVTNRNQVMGLTTAAGLWADACVGLAIGAGFYMGAILAALFILFIVIVMSGIDERLQNVSKFLQIYVEFISPSDLSNLLSYSIQSGMTVNEVSMVKSQDPTHNLAAMINLKLPKKVEHQLVIDELRQIDGVRYVAKL